MGIIPVLEEKITVQGKSWDIDVTTTTSDLSMEEEGTMQIALRPAKSNEWTHGCTVPLRCGKDFLDRFIAAFCAHEDFRKRCEDFGDGSELDEETNSGSCVPKLPAAPRPKMSAGVSKIVRLGNKAKFRDFASLRSGRDEYSSKKEPELVAILGEKATATDQVIANKCKGLEQAERLKAMRWVARGLPPAMAVRKVMTDLEIAEKARG